ncbi:glycosyltransferase family 4 protein [Devosia sp. YIM 151766]|uniref:glycosyltransferase family 4 protein n=1 Tax=Devosia sp. YIM 151766 TaxID=3017325 RepID=UPI00255C4133|nr:glycosyltransferase family 4 protein [Devosia sp. YIM 151766]WIY52441.1 glycosyltransferase family 4 protein [Devosia sp. YIM 151766]
MCIAIIGNAGGSMLNFRAPLIQDIIALGHKVLAFAPDYDDDTKEKLREVGAVPLDYTLSRTGLNPFRDFSDIVRLRRELEGISPDMTLSFSIKPVIYGTIAARMANTRHRVALIEGLGYAFTRDGKSSLKRRSVGALARILYRLSLTFAERIFVLNSDDFNDLVDMRIAPANKITVLSGIGVELDKWRPAPPVLAPITFTLAARLIKDKGVIEFVEAARIIKAKQGDNVRFVLLGQIDTNPQAIEKATLDKWVEEGIVEWPGHVDMREWLAKTSVFVLPSYYREGVPRSTQEAMAMARPIVTTDVPGCRETVIDGRNGFLVPPRDPALLATAMERFIDEPQRITHMGIESRKMAEERFNVKNINAIMIAAMGLSAR